MDNQFQFFPSCFTFLVFIFMVFKLWMISKIKDSPKNLPPSPWKLPLIGHMHLFLFSLPRHLLRELAEKHGPLMHLKLGELSAIVVSSPETAKQVLKTHDINFSNRPFLLLAIFINFTDNAYAPYGDYRRQLPKFGRFRSIREDHVSNLCRSISSNIGLPINPGDMLCNLSHSIIISTAIGRRCKKPEAFIPLVRKIAEEASGFGISDLFPLVKLFLVISGKKAKLEKLHQVADEDHGGLEFPLTDDNIKAVILDMLQAGTETSTTTIEWALSELMKNPRETLRLHPHLPLLLPRESVERCEINGYEIPSKSKVIVNAWAIGRDPKYWNEAERFNPERFMDSSIDYKGTNYVYSIWCWKKDVSWHII
ncbi:hypothetical protein PTKIN_Ptkin11bG0195100 [Pterospermum kingtungense]